MDKMTNEPDIFKGFKLQGGCYKCQGYIKKCNSCGEKIEILEGKVLDYHTGSAHRCRRRS